MENQLNQRQKTILSIDWDYFNDADFKTRAEVFPHALDFSPEKSVMRWMEPYFENEDIIKIGVKRNQLERLLDFLQSNFLEDTPVYVSCSHKHCYRFINKFFNLENNVKIVNIDYHDDIGDPMEKSLLAENWVTHIINHRIGCNQRTVYKWCSDGDEFANSTKMPAVISNTIKVDYDYCLTQSYDGVFLCRSDDWSPPHLDLLFDKVVKTLQENPNLNVVVSDMITAYPDRMKMLNSFVEEQYNPYSEKFITKE